MTLLPPANEKSRRFTSLQMVHTHTRTELDHWSGPLGTESRKRAIKPDE